MAIDQFTPQEEWRIVECSDAYEVSNHGRVRRRLPGRLSPVGRIVGSNIKRNYTHVSLCQDGRRIDGSVHVLVAAAFIGPRPSDRPHINHVDGDKHNNAVWNLEYVTAGDNNRHANRTGLNPVSCEDNPATRLSNADVMVIRSRYLAGESRLVLSADYHITQTTLADILRGVVFRGLQVGPLTRPILRDVIVSVLMAAGTELNYDEIQRRAESIPRDRARGQCSGGSIRATCAALTKLGVLVRTKRGCYTIRRAA